MRFLFSSVPFFAVAGAIIAVAPASSRAAAATPAPVWIFLRDKGDASIEQQRAAIARFDATLSSDALRRRRTRGVGADSLSLGIQDLPVAPSYARAIAAAGADIRVKSSWLNAISIQATPRELARIRAMPFVDHVQPVIRFAQPMATPEPVPTNPGPIIPPSGGPEDFYGASSVQLNQIKIPQVHALGYTGAGIRIGLLDTGFKRTHAAFNFAGHPIQVLAEHDFLEGDTSTAETTNGQHTHGTEVLGCIGAYQPNVIVGGAYDASFLLAKTEDVSQEVPAEEDNWVAGLEFLENNGADVVTSSLGYIDWYTQSQLNGHTAVTTVAAAAAAARGLPITEAAGNYGHDADPTTNHLFAPADADLVITVGAVTSAGLPASFTSDGPSADGRVKPEVTARGVSDATVSPSNDTATTLVDGTSFATPLTASAVALIIQAHPDWSVEQIRYALFNTASGGGAFDPLYVTGYGLINTLAAVQFSFDKFYTNPSSGNWDTNTNWTGNAKPLNVSDVFITPANGVIVTGPATATRVHRLTLGSTSSGLTQLNLTANATFTVDAALSINPLGRLNITAGTFVAQGDTTNNGTIYNANSAANFSHIAGSGSVIVNFGGTLTAAGIRQDALTVGGTVRITPNGTPASANTLHSLTIAGGAAPTGTLDLADNSLVIDYAGASPLPTIASDIAFAYHNGAWDRPSLTSSLADATHFALGYLDNGDTITIDLTRYGDANLDRVVNLADFNTLASHFGQSGQFWSNGDFTYDGLVNLNDFNKLASNFGLAALAHDPTPQDWSNLAAAVPEPVASTMALAIALTSSLLLRGRNRPACSAC
jgi:hypothetical protein